MGTDFLYYWHCLVSLYRNFWRTLQKVPTLYSRCSETPEQLIYRSHHAPEESSDQKAARGTIFVRALSRRSGPQRISSIYHFLCPCRGRAAPDDQSEWQFHTRLICQAERG